MANWITERIIEDKIIIEGRPFIRRAIYHFNENKYKIIWYIYKKGKQVIKSPVQFNKLEILYQAKKDRY